MPLLQTSGNVTADGYGGGVAAVPNYIEDVFSTYLYTGNGSTQTITNGIDLSTNGGLVWIKNRDNANTNNNVYDTNRGIYKYLQTNTTDPQTTDVNRVTAFNSNGFSIGAGGGDINRSPDLYASWTFRKQPKFFDVVTYTGTGSNTTISHSLGSVPACIMVKRTDTTGDWQVYHSSLANTEYLVLNTTAAKATGATRWNSTTPTSTVFSIGTDATVNASGGTYVAYLFAHDAGGFGLTGSDNVISCGSFTDTTTVNLGYEPQWVLFKKSSSSSIGDWFIADNMRGFSETSINTLSANTSSAEASYSNTGCVLTSTGFTYNTGLAGSGTFIYIAIRRGPMKVPTSGTSVFSVESYNQTSASDPAFNLGKVADAGLRRVSDFVDSWRFQSRLTGNGGLITSNTDAESTMNYGKWDNNVGWYQGAAITPPYSQANWYGWTFARATSFFDEVCYTGNGSSNNAKTHNLGVAPELLIIKNRSSSGSGDWYTFHTFTSSNFKKQLLDTTDAQTNYTYGSFLDAQPTSTTFTVNSGAGCNESGVTYVAYLFATCAGVSKVGSYTGTGTTLQVNCGFTGGARFVLIKRTDSTGDWYVWDSARGIVAGNDPYLLLNSTAAEVTNTDYVDTYSAGFEISSTAPAAINASGGTFIFLAIA